MKTFSILILMMVFFTGYVSSASAIASLSIGTISYDTTVVKDESITITSSVTASTVTLSTTLTVDVTLTDNSGLFSIPTATQQVQFTTDGTQSVTWTITATSTGTNAAPFSILATGDESGGTPASGTSSTVLNVKDRPVISVTASRSASSVATGGTVTLGYLISNAAATGAADATNVAVNLTLPTGFSLTSGTSSYSLGSISAQGSTSGTWVVTADSPSTTNTFTMSVTSTIPGGTVSTTTSVSATTSSSSSTSGSSGGGGGGGGGVSGENYNNIELKEKYDETIYKDKTTSYRFKNASSAVMFINITGNTNAGLINTALELLKGRSSLVNVTVPGVVYKNFNVWVGTTGFVSTKNIQAASVGFRVLNSWLTDNDILATDIRLVRWDGTKWVQLETTQNSKDSTYTYFEAKTTAFANFAIAGLNGEIVPAATTESETLEQFTAIEETPVESQKKGTPGFEIALSAAVLSMLYLFVRSRR